MMNDFKNIEPYLILEITQDATKTEIEKAYRKKALKLHPDKNPDNPNATQSFLQLQQALEILLDDSARQAYDNVLKARRANELRNSKLDEKRKRLKQELEARELEYATYLNNKNHDKKTDEELFAEEIKRVMREGYKDLEDEREKLRAQTSKVKLENMYNSSKSVPINNNSKIKLRWNAMPEWKQTDDNTYTTKSLRMIFSKYGYVKEVVLSVSSTPRKGSALIEMDLEHSATMSVKIEKGFPGNPLRCKLISDKAVPCYTSSTNFGNHDQASIITSHHQNNCFDYESLMSRKMRQAEERKRLEREMIEDEEE